MSGGLLSLDVQESWLTRREPRLRVVAACAFALVTVSLQQLWLVVTAFAFGVALTLSAGFSLRLLWRRLLWLEGLMLLLLVLLPFSVPGEPLWSLGPFEASREGLLQAFIMLLKANGVVLALLALIGTLGPVALGHALAGLRLPEKLVHLLLFTVRYLDVLDNEYRRLRQAMNSRGFRARSDRHSWRSLGWLMGMLLVRSLERSRRILAAMKCRGFNGRFYLPDPCPWRSGDTLFAIAGLLALSAFLVLEFIP